MKYMHCQAEMNRNSVSFHIKREGFHVSHDHFLELFRDFFFTFTSNKINRKCYESK